jgi:TolB-like protein/DNA-binding winged helix-turn-helix (wHTH) protein/tetratricopeptide (TPR) repeat protein
MGMSDDRIHLFENFTLDLTRGFLLRGDELVHLRPQTYEVLKYLVENRGRLISKDKLIEDVWQGRAVTDGSLGKCIEEVRDALGENALKYVRNVRGRGYLFESEVAGGENIAATSEQIDVLRVVVVEEEKERGTAHIAETFRKHKLGLGIVLSVLVLAAGVLGYWFFAGRAANSAKIESVAVLPFLNESSDPNTEYLSDGISESLINSLSQLPHLKVIARSSSFMYKGKEVDPQKVASALGVQGIVTGRIVQRGDNLQISVELVNAPDKTQLWGGQYNRKATDLQAVQEEIARTISEKLRLRLTGTQELQLTKHATHNPQAYQLYLNGLFYLRTGRIENTRKALDYFNQAVALDPNFALAWVGVARAYSNFAGNSWLDPKEALVKAKTATQKALELDETLAEAHAGLAVIKLSEWDWQGAEAECKRAIELNPNMADARFRYAEYLQLMGRHAEGLAEIKRGQELDPIPNIIRVREASALFLARRYDEAIEILQNAIKLAPDSIGAHNTLGFTYASKGMYEQAINEYREVIRIQGETTSVQCYLGHALAMSGKRDEAQGILTRLKTAKKYVSPTELAVLYVGLGDNDGAIASLEKAYAAHDLQLATLKIEPGFDRLRSDSRFQDIVRRVGLPL